MAHRQVFISYGHADAQELAFRLERDLTEKGHRVWIDKDRVRAGTAWEEEIERAILESDVIVALLSPRAVRRPDGVCLDEISMARYNNRKIVPAMVIPCRPPLAIYRLDWIDFVHWKNQAGYELSFAQLLTAIEQPEDVDGLHANIFASLKPLDFGVEVSRLRRDFIGRQWLLNELEGWLLQNNSRVFVITGDPGAGKSAVMAHLVNRHPQVAAYHFCIASLADSLDPFTFVRSIAAQLATQYENYRAGLQALDLKHVADYDPGVLFRRLVSEPLHAERPPRPLLLLVDALDEAFSQGPRNIARVLCERLDDLPQWVRLVVSTRKEPEILALFSRFRSYEIDTGREENQQDVASYLEHKLREPGLAKTLSEVEIDLKTIAAWISQKSEGNFLYVTQALAAIEDGLMDLRRPDSFPGGLLGIYQCFFERVFPERADYVAFRPLLNILCAAREPLDAEQIAMFSNRNRFDVEQDLEKVAAYFPERNGVYATYHKSVSDWLAGTAGHSRKFRVNLEAGHLWIAECLLAAYKAGNATRFTVEHLPAHLAATHAWEMLKGLLMDFRFLKAKIEAMGPPSLIEDYHTILAQGAGGPYSLSDDDIRALELLRDTLSLSAHILTDDSEQLASQLTGRLLGSTSSQIRGLMEQVCNEQRAPWARPLAPSLIAPGGPLLRTLTGHSSVVSKVALTPEGRRAVSCSDDHSLMVWDLDTGVRLHTLAGHQGPVRLVRVLPDGWRVISGSTDGTIKLWDLEAGRDLRTLAAQSGGVLSISMLPDGRLISGYLDGTLRVWNIDTGQELMVLTGHSDGVRQLAVLSDGHRVVSGSNDLTLKVWDLELGQVLHTLEGHLGWVEAVSITPDETLAVSASMDGTLKVWDLISGKMLHTLTGHMEWITAVRVFPDGSRAVSAAGSLLELPDYPDNTLKVWDLENGEELWTLRGHSGAVLDVALIPDSHHAISTSTDKTLKVWDLNTGDMLQTFTGHSDWVFKVAVTPGGRRAVSAARDCTLKVWDLHVLQAQEMLSRHTGPVWDVSVLQDGRQAISRSADGTLKLWDLDTGMVVRTFSRHLGWVTAFAVLPDGRRGVSASADQTLKLWDLQTGEALCTYSGHSKAVWALAVLQDGRRVVSGADDNTLRVWDLESGETLCVLVGHSERVSEVQILPHDAQVVSVAWDTIKVWDLETGELSHTVKHRDRITKLAFLPDGRIVSVSFDGMLRVWNLKTDHELCALYAHSDWIYDVALMKDCRQAVTASKDHTLRVWDLETGQSLRTLEQHLDAVFRVLILADGRRGISVSFDNTLIVWDLKEGKAMHTLAGHSGSITGTVVIQDGRRVVTASVDKTIRIWNLERGELLATFTGEDGFISCAAALDGKTIIAGEDSGRVHVLRLQGI